MTASPAFSLEDQNIAITGAAGGIGSSAAELCASLGARVALADLASPTSVADRIEGAGGAVTASAVDVSDRASVEAWAQSVGPVDALIDCAAICPFDTWTDRGWDEVFERVLDINLGGPINLVRAFLPAMIARGGGRIALVGSIAGKIGGVLSSPHYVMSKGGIHAFVRWAAKQGAPHNVLVNAVAPGPVDTPMTENQAFDFSAIPLRRKATAEEIGGPLVFLISPAASYISGAVLDINGAMHFS